MVGMTVIFMVGMTVISMVGMTVISTGAKRNGEISNLNIFVKYRSCLSMN